MTVVAGQGSLHRKSLRLVSAVDALVETLRNAVLDGELEPGQVITEGEIVEAYDVSRPTVKAAIRELVAERVLRQEPNRSAAVAKPSANDVIDLFRLRVPLELEIVREIIKSRATKDPAFQISKDAHSAVADMLQIGDFDAKPHEFVAADLKFHKALAESAGSDRLLHVFEELEGEIHLSMLQSFNFLDHDRIGQEHKEILDLIEAAVASEDKDWKPAKRAMKAHLRSACELIADGLNKANALPPKY